MSSFLIISRDIFSESKYRDNLDNNAIVAYILLGDRMKLSIKNNLIDNKKGVHFIFYKINDLARDMRKSRGVAIKALKQLKNVGLVNKRRMFKESNHIFLPKFNFKHRVSPKIELHNNNKLINNKYSNSSSDRRIRKNRNRWQNTNIPKVDSKLDHQNAIKATKYRRIPKPVTSMLEHIFNGKTLTKCIHIILEAKRSVFKDNKNSKYYARIVKYALDFDINDYFTFDNSKDFVNYLNHGLRKAWHCARSGKLWNYIMKVCKTYFEHALRYYYISQSYKITSKNQPEIPIFKI